MLFKRHMRVLRFLHEDNKNGTTIEIALKQRCPHTFLDSLFAQELRLDNQGR